MTQCIQNAVKEEKHVWYQSKLGVAKTGLLLLVNSLANSESSTILVICQNSQSNFEEYRRLAKKVTKFDVKIVWNDDEFETESHLDNRIVIGTPDKICLLTENEHFKYLILDECDEMLEELGKFSLQF